MNLKKYDRKDCKHIAPGKPSVHMTNKGVFSLNKAAVQGIGLKKEDKILFVQDELIPKDWYIQKTDSEDGFVLRENQGRLILNASKIVQNIFKSLEINKESAGFRIATEPTEDNGESYFAILTRVPDKQKELV